MKKLHSLNGAKLNDFRNEKVWMRERTKQELVLLLLIVVPSKTTVHISRIASPSERMITLCLLLYILLFGHT
jgi:hypothetical protein